MKPCIDPILVTFDSKGKRHFRHFTLSSEHHIKHHQLRFDCKKCIHCRKARAYELAARCTLHASLYKENSFLTLTYDESKPEYHNNFQYKDVQDFKKRYRQYVSRTLKRRVEIFNVHEYGRNGKKHWHLIVFNHDFSEERDFHTRRGLHNVYTSTQLEKLWPHGLSEIGSVEQGSAMYIAQYMEKDFQHGYVTSTKKSHSKHSGLGRPYFLNHYKQILSLGYVPYNGFKLAMPKYFERLAHKHYSHYYEKENFFDFHHRKKLYTPFKHGEENPEIAELYIQYKARKKLVLQDLEAEWHQTVQQFLTTKDTPDFILSGQNTLHDLNNKIKKEKF